MNDPEISAMAAVSAALLQIEDLEARARVIRWVNERFGFVASERFKRAPVSASVPISEASGTKELAGIARLLDTGDFRLTVRDLKATSANDAAVRLVHVAIRAYQQLTGEKVVSSKSVVVPLLKAWRVYDGNTRATLAKQRGILRNGDELDLDVHAQSDADRFIREALDANVEGRWKPGARKKKASE